MRRWILVAGALALTAAACGDDGAGATTVPVTAPPTTTAPTTTIDPTPYRVNLATIFAGEWTGSWENDTDGTTGPLSAALAVDAEGPSATLTLDLGGEVFGGGDPAPFEMTIDLAAAPPYAGFSPVLGSLSLVMEIDGAFTLEALDVPGAGVASFRASGRATSAGITLGYTVGLDDGGETAGTAYLGRPTG